MRMTATSAITGWTGVHSALMIGSLVLASQAEASLAFIATTAAASFGALTVLARTHWTASGRYGLANAITAFRLGLVFLMLGQTSSLLRAFALALLVLLLDGADGWQARRSNSCSAYGDLFDKEVDAFFTLALCVILYRTDRFGLWILIPGALRYVYSLYERVGSRQAPASAPLCRWTRAAGAFTLGGLTSCLLPLGTIATGIGAAATIVVTFSFLCSFRDLQHR